MQKVHSHPASMAMGSPPGGQVGDRALRVLIVDDHPAVRSGLLQLLEEQPELLVVDAVVGGGGDVFGRARTDRRRGGRLSVGGAVACG